MANVTSKLSIFVVFSLFILMFTGCKNTDIQLQTANYVNDLVQKKLSLLHENLIKYKADAILVREVGDKLAKYEALFNEYESVKFIWTTHMNLFFVPEDPDKKLKREKLEPLVVIAGKRKPLFEQLLKWTMFCEVQTRMLPSAINELELIQKSITDNSKDWDVSTHNTKSYLVSGYGLGFYGGRPDIGQWYYFESNKRAEPAEVLAQNLFNKINAIDETYTKAKGRFQLDNISVAEELAKQ